MSESIESSGYPLGFIMVDGVRPEILGSGEGSSCFVTEARMLAGHQKEALVREGAGGPQWRLTSDEGKHLKGADVSPFPLGFFNAGLQGDLLARLAVNAAKFDFPLSDINVLLRNFYWMTGSFVRGDGEGFSGPPEVNVSCKAELESSLGVLLKRAIVASPAFAALTTPLDNTFALYVNGKRETVESVSQSIAEDAPDPYMTYAKPPSPMIADAVDPIIKTGTVEEGEIRPAPSGTTTQIIRTVTGEAGYVHGSGQVKTDTWLEMPGVSHFTMLSDDQAESKQAPSGLALLSAGIAFCYMTQLSRYIENMKLDIQGIRLVQYTPYAVNSEKGAVQPVDTHLFLNGRADVETHQKLLHIAAKTCYLHATLAASLVPVVTINGKALD